MKDWNIKIFNKNDDMIIEKTNVQGISHFLNQAGVCGDREKKGVIFLSDVSVGVIAEGNREIPLVCVWIPILCATLTRERDRLLSDCEERNYLETKMIFVQGKFIPLSWK